MISKKSLAVTLSKLQGFVKPDEQLEQYATDGEVAATLIHMALMHGDLEGKHVADLGCGTGILGLGAILAGAESATLLDIHKDALEIAKQNAEFLDVSEYIQLINAPVRTVPADLVIMNPPFGSKNAHADKPFVEAAMKSAPIVYSIHDGRSRDWLESLTATHGFALTHVVEAEMLLKNTLVHHKRKVHRIPVILARYERQVQAQPL